MSFYVSTATFFLLHCDEWDRVVALPRHKFVTGATLLQLEYNNNQIEILLYLLRYTGIQHYFQKHIMFVLLSSHTTDVTTGDGTDYHSGTSEFIAIFYGV